MKKTAWLFGISYSLFVVLWTPLLFAQNSSNNEIIAEELIIDVPSLKIGEDDVSPTNDFDDFVFVQGEKPNTSFYIAPYEVSQQEFESVMGYLPENFPATILSNGQEIEFSPEAFEVIGGAKPVAFISLKEMFLYANLLSQLRNLEPVYSDVSTDTITINWQANGYRLPTTEEWLWAAHGGQYTQNTQFAGSDTATDVAWFQGDKSPPTLQTVGQQMPNELNLFDMSGNVSEVTINNVKDDFSLVSVMVYGGSFLEEARALNDTSNGSILTEEFEANVGTGFRLVRNSITEPNIYFTESPEDNAKALLEGNSLSADMELSESSGPQDGQYTAIITDTVAPSSNAPVKTFYVSQEVSDDNQVVVVFRIAKKLPQSKFAKQNLIRLVVEDYNRIFYPDFSQADKTHWQWFDWRMLNTFLYQSGLASEFYDANHNIVNMPYAEAELVYNDSENNFIYFAYLKTDV